MFQPRTVFVVGAGASAEVGLPSGGGIINIIKESLSIKHLPDDRFRYPKLFSVFGEMCENNPDEYNLCIEAAQKIVDGTAYAVSIDNFLHTHRENKHIQIVGKLAIANAVLQAEQDSKLSLTAGKVYSSQVERTWFKKFAMKIFENRTIEELPKIFNDIEIICFNYDRCIEHFLRHAVVSYFSISMEAAEEIVDSLRIHRPYGTVGDLSAVTYRGGDRFSEDNLVYDGNFSDGQLIEASQRIRIFTEDTRDNDSLNAIRGCMMRAARVVFLGFGYISQNMSLLQTEAIGPNRRPIIRGTAHGISESDRKIIESKMWGIYRAPEGGGREGSVTFDIKLDDLTCADFFDQRWHELSQ